MAKTISTTEILGESVIVDVPVLDPNIPLTDNTKMYLDIEQTFRQIPLSRLFNWIKGKMTQVIYPVGSVYLTLDGAADPAVMFGGIWEKMEDTFLLGASDRNIVGTVGGNENNQVTLQVTNLPSHRHGGSTSSEDLVTNSHSHSHTPSNSEYKFTVNKDISGNNTDVERLRVKTDGSSDRWAMTAITMANINQVGYTSTQSHTHTIDGHTHDITTDYTGSGTPIDITPRYTAVYMWKRIN